MNLTTDDLFLLIGIKEAELWALRKKVAELEATQQLAPANGNGIATPDSQGIPV